MRDLERIYLLVEFAIFLYLVLDIVVQILPPHYNPITQPESDLAVGEFGLIMTLNFLNRGIFSLVFIFALQRTCNLTGLVRKRFRIGSLLLGIWAIGSIILALFPTDVPPTPSSFHGTVHFIAAIISFTCGVFGTLSITFELQRSKEFRNLPRIMLITVALAVLFTWMILFSLPFASPHLNSQIGGLTERLFLGSILIWFALASVLLARNVKGLKAGSPP